MVAEREKGTSGVNDVCCVFYGVPRVLEANFCFISSTKTQSRKRLQDVIVGRLCHPGFKE
jgi:hypothetical protein